MGFFAETGTVLTCYVHALWNHLELYGVWPPATLHELMPRDKRNQYVVELVDNKHIVLRESHEKGRFEHILVRGHDLPGALRAIRALRDADKK